MEIIYGKSNSKNFAILLFELTKGKEEGELKKVLKEFTLLLSKKRMLGKAKEILGEYKKIYNQAHNIIEAVVTVTERLDEKTRLKLRETLKKKYKAREVHMLEKVDARLLGGIKVKIDDTVYDASLKHTLNQLQEKLVA